MNPPDARRTTLRSAALAALAGAALGVAPAVRAECAPGPTLQLDAPVSGGDELALLAELIGLATPEPGMLRRGGLRARRLCDGAAAIGWVPRLATAEPVDGLQVLPVRISSTWNSTYPTSGEDGLLWPGRGLSTLASTGVAGRWRLVSWALAPELAWQQNGWYRTPPGSAGRWDSNPWYGASLDLPQRFGAGPFSSAALGQSYLRLDALGVAVGASSENLWWGPGFRNALLLTGTAPGVPHLFLGTSEPVDTPLGKVEALALWGRLERSTSFSPGGHPWLTALAVDYQPRWLPGLTLGAARAFVESARSLRADHLLTVLEGPFKSQVTGGDNPQDNQIAALWLRWVAPESGLEVHGEWGRDDFPNSLAGLTREPDRTAAWILGLQKVSAVGRGHLRFQLELANLHAFNSPSAFGGLPVWYAHPGDLGFSYRGQILGASIGPGGDSQFMAVDYFGEQGRFGAFVERARRNEEIFWAYIEPQGRDSQHDTELRGGLRQLLFIGRVELSWEASLAYRWNRDFGPNEPNLHLAVDLRWPVRPSALTGPTAP